jgi:hypothetical protein
VSADTDAAFMLRLLRRSPMTTMEIIQASYAERRCGLTPHSRAADLRRDGYDVRCTRVGTHHGRGTYRYALHVAPVQLRLGENAA